MFILKLKCICNNYIFAVKNTIKNSWENVFSGACSLYLLVYDLHHKNHTLTTSCEMLTR